MTEAQERVLDSIHDIQNLNRAYSDWASPRGLDRESLPFRLWEKAINLVWDPRDIDFSQDVEDWKKMAPEQQAGIIGLASGFMVGEEGVTLDILPLVLAMADEGRVEECMYLTTFAFEEAKHVDMFELWFKSVGVNLSEYREQMRARARERGQEPADPNERRGGLFEQELPRVMRRLLIDRSDEAFLDAAVTYNQFVEGCLALAGYRVWTQMFNAFGVLPGLRHGLTLTQRDERRHIAYGTYLARRCIAKNPDLFEFAESRMYSLRDGYYGMANVARAQEQGNGQAQEGNGQAAEGGSGYGGGAAGGVLSPFIQHAMSQVERRIEVMRKAKDLSADEAERGTGSEEAEVELENA